MPKITLFFEFHPHVCLVKSQETHKVFLQGFVGVDGLYTFNNLQLQGSPLLLMSTFVPVTNADLSYSTANVNSSSNIGSKSVVSSTSVANLWHASLGHPNDHVMKIVLNHCNIFHLNKNFTEFCSSCCMGKAHRLPSHNSTSVY